MKWVNGEITECWPQELFVVKLNDDDDDDDDGFSYHDEEFGEDGNLDASATDDKSEDWVTEISSESSK